MFKRKTNVRNFKRRTVGQNPKFISKNIKIIAVDAKRKMQSNFLKSEVVVVIRAKLCRDLI